MYVLQNLHFFVIFIGVLVFVHELGHFLLAKACNIKVLKFSLGFGPRLLGFTRGETEYVISALPLGGYVKMLGEMQEGDMDPSDEPRAFNNRPLYQRAAVVLAGPVFNFILAYFVYMFLLTGTQTFGDTRLGVVAEGYPAWNAGIRPGDRVVAIDGEEISDWDGLKTRISARPGESLTITYERDGKRTTTELSTRVETTSNVFKELERQGRVGVSLQYILSKVGVVDPESPASLAGLKTDDVIVAVGDTKTEAWHEVRNAVAKYSVGDSVPVTFSRDGNEQTVTLVPSAPVAEIPSDTFSSADVKDGYTGLVSKDVLVTQVDPETPAATIGLAAGDRLLSLGIKREGEVRVQRIGAWDIDLDAFTGVDATSEFVLTYQRGRDVVTRELTLIERTEVDEFKNERKQYVFGALHDRDASSLYTFERRVGIIEASVGALYRVGAAMTIISKGIAKMAQGDIPLDNMGGPIMLFYIAEKSAKRGLNDFLSMMAIISVNLGLVNLLPIPVLDGGTLVFLGIEAVRRRPPSVRVREVANLVGLAILMLLMVVVFKNDIFRFVLG